MSTVVANPNASSLAGVITMCSTGFELHKLYEMAEKEKVAAASRLASSPTASPQDKQMVAAKQRYVETFANWLSHRAFCHDCKPGAPAHA
jgi:hypothetical protein